MFWRYTLTPLLYINKKEDRRVTCSKWTRGHNQCGLVLEPRSPDLQSAIFPSQAMRPKDTNNIIHRKYY